MTTMESIPAKFDAFMHERWRELCDGITPAVKSYIQGCIDSAMLCGAIDSTIAELWLLRIEKCPGHDDEGARAWCAYCGDLPKDEDA